VSSEPTNSDSEFVILGKIIGFFGVRGWVKVHSDTDPRENIVTYSRWWLGDANNRKPIGVTGGKRSGKNVVARLAGIESREMAETVLGQQIAVPRADLPALDGEEYYWADLVGCEVLTLEGVTVGPVNRLFETGANDVMVVTDRRAGSESRDGDILIPWIRSSVIISVNVAERQIVVDWDPDF